MDVNKNQLYKVTGREIEVVQFTSFKEWCDALASGGQYYESLEAAIDSAFDSAKSMADMVHWATFGQEG